MIASGFPCTAPSLLVPVIPPSRFTVPNSPLAIDVPLGLAFKLNRPANYQYPEAALQQGVSGVVEVSFVVEKDGTLTDINIKRDVSHGTGKAAVELLIKAKK